MLHWIDLSILAILAVTLLVGLWRGFVSEVLAIVAWITAFIAARMLSPLTADWLVNYIDNEAVVMLFAWLIPFLLAFIAVNLLKTILKTMVDMVGLKPVDRLFGAVFGMVKGGLLITAIVLVAQLALAESRRPFETDSRFLPYFQSLALWFVENLDAPEKLDLTQFLPKSESIDKVVSQAAMSLGIDRDQVSGLQKHLNIDTEELLSRLNDPKQLEELRKMLEDSKLLEKLSGESPQ